MNILSAAGYCAEIPNSDDQAKSDRSLTAAEQALYANPYPPLAAVKRELDLLPPLTAKRASWLRRKGITFDDGANKFYEIPPSHPLNEYGETALAFPIADKQGETIDFGIFLPRYLDQPRRGRLCHRATLINESALTARQYTKAAPLHVWWNAFNWLKAGRIGIVILDPAAAEANDALAAVPWLAAESYRHAEASFDWGFANYGKKVLVPKRTDFI